MEKFRTVNAITVKSALDIVQAVIDEGKKNGVSMSACVVDPAMGLIAFARGDGATPHSVETSRRKANTAVSTGKPTGWMPPELAVSLPLGTGNLLTNLGGGIPVRFDGILVGGLGVAGGTVEQDIEIGKAALKAVGADLA